ncbi:MAG: hypothetical protein QOE79_2160 [Sphingomonadales bacterium]|nr:hypothetical protein [Sphingomonadales bacterium]MEA3049754.1 hypothetical protein [Sphingomonadales bacterium]
MSLGWLLLALLACFDSGVAIAGPARSDAEFSMAEARRLSTKDLARVVFGLAGGNYVESKVGWNTGWPVSGVFSVEFATRPKSAGFPGLCEAEYLNVEFRPSSRNKRAEGDRATFSGYSQSKRFGILPTRAAAAMGGDVPDSQDRQCEALRPILGRDQPNFFGGSWMEGPDFRAVDAAFATQAFLQAQASARDLPPLDCKGEPDRPDDDLCRDSMSVLTSFPAQHIGSFGLDRCPNAPAHFCVTARAARTPSGGLEGHDLIFTIVTDATSIDPPKPFHVTAVAIRGEHWAV